MSAANAVPGRQLLHPLPLAGAALILVNDLWLKLEHPGWWSGKLSDAGICALLPAVVASALQWALFAAAAVRGRRDTWDAGCNSRWLPIAACGVAAVYFSLLQLSPSFVALHRGWISSLAPGLDARVTMDPSDCLVLPIVLLAYAQLERHRRWAARGAKAGAPAAAREVCG